MMMMVILMIYHNNNDNVDAAGDVSLWVYLFQVFWLCRLEYTPFTSYFPLSCATGTGGRGYWSHRCASDGTRRWRGRERTRDVWLAVHLGHWPLPAGLCPWHLHSHRQSGLWAGQCPLLQSCVVAWIEFLVIFISWRLWFSSTASTMGFIVSAFAILLCSKDRFLDHSHIFAS